MTLRHWLLFILSAFLFGAPLLWSTYTWPLVFLFAIPLLYVAVYNNLSFGYGFLWGIIAFGTHTSGVFLGLDNMARGSVAERFAPVLLIISYISLFTLIWFAINKKIIDYFALHSVLEKLTVWVITYWLFILFMEHYSLAIFSRYEGYFLFNPVFVLAEKPQLLTLLPYIGKSMLLLLILCLSGSIVYAYITRSIQSFIVLLMFTIPWILSLTIAIPTTEAPLWLSKIAPLPVIIPDMINLNKQALATQELLKSAAERYPEAQLIITPESSMQCSHLSTTPALCGIWSEKELGRPLHIIIGAFRWDGPDYRNTLHWINNGNLEKIFDKRHAMLLTEQIPPAFKLKVLEHLFFTTFPGVTPATAPRPLFNVFPGVSFIPYICSELFFNDQPDDNYEKGSTILANTNDSWCMNTNIAALMHLAARFRAIQWQRNILYISFLYATYFDTYGNQFNVKTNASAASFQ